MRTTSATTQQRRKTPSKATPSIQSVDRALLILEAVGRSSEPVPIGYLRGLLDIDHSSVFRLANTLKRRGFLANPSAGKEYVLGPSIWRLAHQYDWGKMLVTIARDQLKSLAETTKETAHLAVREGIHALFVDHVAANHVISVAGRTGESLPLYCTSHGKALLADFDEPSLKSLYGAKRLKSYTPRTICTIGDLAAACADIRTRGYATDDAELIEGVRCVAAPIRDKDGVVIASIGISAPQTRFPAEAYPERGAQVCKIARKIGDLLRSQTD